MASNVEKKMMMKCNPTLRVGLWTRCHRSIDSKVANKFDQLIKMNRNDAIKKKLCGKFDRVGERYYELVRSAQSITLAEIKLEQREREERERKFKRKCRAI